MWRSFPMLPDRVTESRQSRAPSSPAHTRSVTPSVATTAETPVSTPAPDGTAPLPPAVGRLTFRPHGGHAIRSQLPEHRREQLHDWADDSRRETEDEL